MNCPICETEMVAPPPPEREIRFSTNLGDGGEPEPGGMVCTNPECKAATPCGQCEQGWSALEVEPRVDWEKSVGTMTQYLKPGDEYIVCPANHRRLVRAVPPGPSQMDVLARMAEG